MTDWYQYPIWLDGPRVPIFVKMRQSNCNGKPLPPTVLDPTVPRTDVRLWHCHMSFPNVFRKITIDPLHYRCFDTDDGLYPNRLATGGEVELGVRMADVYCRPSVIASCFALATGYPQWAPMTTTGLTSRAIGFVDLLIERLAAEGKRGYVAGFVFTGGEEECSGDGSQSVIYGSTVLAEEGFRWWSRYGDAPFVIDRLRADVPLYPPYVQNVRVGEQAFVDAHPDKVGLVDTSSCPLLPYPDVHYSPDGQAIKGGLDADCLASFPAYEPTEATHVRGEIYTSEALAREVAARFGTRVRKDPVDARWAAETPIGRHDISLAGWAVV